MKKLFLSAAVLALASFSTVKAYTPYHNIAISYQVNDDTRTPVKLEDLPDGVKKVLAGDGFKEWTPTEAFLVKTDKGVEYYDILVKKGEQTGSLKMDKDGNAIKDAAETTPAPGKTETAPDQQKTETAPDHQKTETAPDQQKTEQEKTEQAPQQEKPETAPAK